MKYSEQLRDPRWRELREKIIERAGHKCENCDSEEKRYEVHHGYYIKGRMAWEYPEEVLYCLCEQCHWDIQERMEIAHYEVAKRNLDLYRLTVLLRREIPVRTKDGFEIDNTTESKEKTSFILHG